MAIRWVGGCPESRGWEGIGEVSQVKERVTDGSGWEMRD